jgi:carboxymethylenebutenolidase
MCFEFDALPPEVPADRILPRLAGGAAAEITTLVSADEARFSVAVAECPEPRGPAVIILPDVRGLYRFYIELAERLVTAGHHAIAIDYFGRTAGSGEREQDFHYMAHLAEIDPAQVQADIAAARDALAERTGATEFVTVGFCFGGAYSFIAATNPDLELAAAVGFYGTLDGSRLGPIFPSPIESGTETKVPVLGLFGGDDDFIPAEDIERFDAQLERADVPHDLRVYPGAPHSFFDRSAEQFADESADAWRRLLDFLGRTPVAG